MRTMNERGQDEKSLDSSLRDDQTRAEEIEMLRIVAKRQGSVKYFVVDHQLDPKASLSLFTHPDAVYIFSNWTPKRVFSLFTHPDAVYFLVESFPYTDRSL